MSFPYPDRERYLVWQHFRRVFIFASFRRTEGLHPIHPKTPRVCLITADHSGDDRKKKKKSSHSTSDRARIEAEITDRTKEKEKIDEIAETRAASGSSSAEITKGAGGAGSNGGRKLTEAERRFEETQRKRVGGMFLTAKLDLATNLTDDNPTIQRHERVAKMAGQTHKDRVQEFNAKLDLLRWVLLGYGLSALRVLSPCLRKRSFEDSELTSID